MDMNALMRQAQSMQKQLQKKNPKLSDDILLSLNPELSEIVGQTLVHDLSEQDFNKLIKIATHFYNTKPNDNIDKFDGLIDNAVKIISDATVRNPFLLDKLLYVYQGNFPQTYLYSPQLKSSKTK